MKSALTRRTLPVVPCQGQNAVDLLAATQHAKLCAGERKGLQAKGGKKPWRGWGERGGGGGGAVSLCRGRCGLECCTEHENIKEHQIVTKQSNRLKVYFIQMLS